jgi:hypothetical protein
MSEIASFGNLVNALSVVRHDYHEQLKSIAQYEAFLLIESSTQKVAETLNGLANSPKPSMAAEVISTLELAKTKFREHLTSVPEYRALLAVDKLISDVSIDLGVHPAPQTVLPAEEAEAPSHEIASTQPEAEQVVSASEPVVARTEAAEIAPTEPVAATQPEPDLAGSASEHTVPEAAETASTEHVAATEPEPDLIGFASEHTVPEAVETASAEHVAATEPDLIGFASEHTVPDAAEIASTHQVAATETQPDLAVSASEHTVTQPEPAQFPFTQPLSAARDRYSSDLIPANEPTGTGVPSGDAVPAAVEDLHNFVEPPAEPRDAGSEEAA